MAGKIKARIEGDIITLHEVVEASPVTTPQKTKKKPTQTPQKVPVTTIETTSFSLNELPEGIRNAIAANIELERKVLQRINRVIPVGV